MKLFISRYYLHFLVVALVAVGAWNRFDRGVDHDPRPRKVAKTLVTVGKLDEANATAFLSPHIEKVPLLTEDGLPIAVERTLSLEMAIARLNLRTAKFPPDYFSLGLVPDERDPALNLVVALRFAREKVAALDP